MIVDLRVRKRVRGWLVECDWPPVQEAGLVDERPAKGRGWRR